MATQGGIAHAKLTDPNLHEPKGASTAAVDTVPFADGDGNTEWHTVTFEKLDFEAPEVQEHSEDAIEVPDELDVLGLSAETDGICTDGVNFTQTNKNIAETAKKINESLVAFNDLYGLHKDLVDKVNGLISALQTLGIITDGE